MGLYQHYKGSYYLTLFKATHTETGEELVVYYNVEDKSKVWARPSSMFFENVRFDDVEVPRFREVTVPDNLTNFGIGEEE